ncbi:MAG: hypothetical protein FWD98_01530 [Defluviitaleaceae bacterium]|nr:hypothetical protein [Defluviitaleaceae bacterium]
MSENTTREPDNIIVVEKDGTKYTIREFFDGKEELIDIIANRVIKDVNPPLSSSMNG